MTDKQQPDSAESAGSEKKKQLSLSVTASGVDDITDEQREELGDAVAQILGVDRNGVVIQGP